MSFEAHVGGRRIRVDGPVDDTQFFSLAAAAQRIFAEPTNLVETLALRGIKASEWTGNLHLHLGGKTGETIFAATVYPLVRTVCPRVAIILHIHPAFRRVAMDTQPAPDGFLCDSWWTEHDGPVADQVSAGLKQVSAWLGGPWRWSNASDLHACLYRTWRGTKPFYRLFAEAAGVEGAPKAPFWHHIYWKQFRASISGKPIVPPAGSAVVLASGNKHTGGARLIGLSPAQWQRLADECRAAGHEPVTTAASGDPRPDMPGWYFLETDKPEEIVSLTAAAHRVVGLNSGIVFAATLFSPGRVTMLDTQTPERRPAYAFAPMVEDGMIDARHVQIPWEEAEQDLFETVRKALT